MRSLPADHVNNVPSVACLAEHAMVMFSYFLYCTGTLANKVNLLTFINADVFITTRVFTDHVMVHGPRRVGHALLWSRNFHPNCQVSQIQISANVQRLLSSLRPAHFVQVQLPGSISDSTRCNAPCWSLVAYLRYPLKSCAFRCVSVCLLN